jgi:hypothetical protein
VARYVINKLFTIFNNKKIERKIKFQIKKIYILKKGGGYIRYPDITRDCVFFREDGIPPLDIGNNIFIKVTIPFLDCHRITVLNLSKHRLGRPGRLRDSRKAYFIREEPTIQILSCEPTQI